MRSPEDLALALRLLLRREISLELTAPRAAPVRAVRAGPGAWRLTLHPCFRLAAEDVLRDLARHLTCPREETAERLRRFSRAARDLLPTGAHREPPLQPVGQHFDLAEISRTMNHRHFDGRLRTRITWGRAGSPRRRRRRSIVFGSYQVSTDTVRIHPNLDSPQVPRLFLEYIVFHELLHAVHPVQVDAEGRRIVHSAAFHRDERRFPQLDEALRHLRAWSSWVR
jgi:hypothetical protein